MPLAIYVVCTMIDMRRLVKHGAYMNFKEATDILLPGIPHERLASELGLSIPAIRQARLAETANAYRPARPGWERAVIKLARAKCKSLQLLIDALEKQALRSS